MILGLREEASAAATCACTYAAHCCRRIYDSTMAGSVELLLRQPIGCKRGSAVLSHSRMSFFDSVAEPGGRYSAEVPEGAANILDSRGSAAIGDG